MFDATSLEFRRRDNSVETIDLFQLVQFDSSGFGDLSETLRLFAQQADGIHKLVNRLRMTLPKKATNQRFSLSHVNLPKPGEILNFLPLSEASDHAFVYGR